MPRVDFSEYGGEGDFFVPEDVVSQGKSAIAKFYNDYQKETGGTEIDFARGGAATPASLEELAGKSQNLDVNRAKEVLAGQPGLTKGQVFATVAQEVLAERPGPVFATLAPKALSQGKPIPVAPAPEVPAKQINPLDFSPSVHTPGANIKVWDALTKAADKYGNDPRALAAIEAAKARYQAPEYLAAKQRYLKGLGHLNDMAEQAGRIEKNTAEAGDFYTPDKFAPGEGPGEAMLAPALSAALGPVSALGSVVGKAIDLAKGKRPDVGEQARMRLHNYSRGITGNIDPEMDVLVDPAAGLKEKAKAVASTAWGTAFPGRKLADLAGVGNEAMDEASLASKAERNAAALARAAKGKTGPQRWGTGLVPEEAALPVPRGEEITTPRATGGVIQEPEKLKIRDYARRGALELGATGATVALDPMNILAPGAMGAVANVSGKIGLLRWLGAQAANPATGLLGSIAANSIRRLLSAGKSSAVVPLYFSVQLGREVPALVAETYDASTSGDPKRLTKALADSIATVGMLGAMGWHGFQRTRQNEVIPKLSLQTDDAAVKTFEDLLPQAKIQNPEPGFFTATVGDNVYKLRVVGEDFVPNEADAARGLGDVSEAPSWYDTTTGTAVFRRNIADVGHFNHELAHAVVLGEKVGKDLGVLEESLGMKYGSLSNPAAMRALAERLQQRGDPGDTGKAGELIRAAEETEIVAEAVEGASGVSPGGAQAEAVLKDIGKRHPELVNRLTEAAGDPVLAAGIRGGVAEKDFEGILRPLEMARYKAAMGLGPEDPLSPALFGLAMVRKGPQGYADFAHRQALGILEALRTRKANASTVMRDLLLGRYLGNKSVPQEVKTPEEIAREGEAPTAQVDLGADMRRAIEIHRRLEDAEKSLKGMRVASADPATRESIEQNRVELAAEIDRLRQESSAASERLRVSFDKMPAEIQKVRDNAVAEKAKLDLGTAEGRERALIIDDKVADAEAVFERIQKLQMANPDVDPKYLNPIQTVNETYSRLMDTSSRMGAVGERIKSVRAAIENEKNALILPGLRKSLSELVDVRDKLETHVANLLQDIDPDRLEHTLLLDDPFSSSGRGPIGERIIPEEISKARDKAFDQLAKIREVMDSRAISPEATAPSTGNAGVWGQGNDIRYARNYTKRERRTRSVEEDERLAKKISALEAEIDARYESGKIRGIERLEDRLAKMAQDREEDYEPTEGEYFGQGRYKNNLVESSGQAASGDQFHNQGVENPGLEAWLADRYEDLRQMPTEDGGLGHVIPGKYLPYGSRSDLVEAMRDGMWDSALESLSGSPEYLSTVQNRIKDAPAENIVRAARDAWERQTALRARLKSPPAPQWAKQEENVRYFVRAVRPGIRYARSYTKLAQMSPAQQEFFKTLDTKRGFKAAAPPSEPALVRFWARAVDSSGIMRNREDAANMDRIRRGKDPIPFEKRASTLADSAPSAIGDAIRMIFGYSGKNERGEVVHEGPFRFGQNWESIPTGGRPLVEILRDVTRNGKDKDRISVFNGVVEALQARDRWNAGVDAGKGSRAVLDAALAQAEKDDPEIFKLAQEKTQWNNDLLDYTVDLVGGKNLAKVSKEKYKHYLSMTRLFEEDYAGAGSPKSPEGGIYKMGTGGPRKTIDPFFRDVQRAVKLTSFARRQSVLRTLAGLHDADPVLWAGIISEKPMTAKQQIDSSRAASSVPGVLEHNVRLVMQEAAEHKIPMTIDEAKVIAGVFETRRDFHQKSNTFHVMTDEGRTRTFYVDGETARFIDSMAPVDAGFMRLVSILGAASFSKTLRWGVTHEPQFPVINVARDADTAANDTRRKDFFPSFRAYTGTAIGLGKEMRDVWGTPVAEMAYRALGIEPRAPSLQDARARADYQQHVASLGGVGSGERGQADLFYSLARKTGRDVPEFIFLKNKEDAGAFAKTLAAAAEKAQRGISVVAEKADVLTSPFEQAARRAEWEGLKKGGASNLEAALGARDVTVDFWRHGQAQMPLKFLGAISPFFNAGLQGTDRMLRAFGVNLGKSQGKFDAQQFGVGVRRMLLWNAARAAVLWLVNAGDKEIEERRKGPGGINYFYLRLPGTPGRPNGYVIAWPKAFMQGAIGASGIEAALDWLRNEYPEKMEQAIKLVRPEYAYNERNEWTYQPGKNVLRSAKEQISPFSWPPIASLGVGLMSGKDPYSGFPIEPRGSEALKLSPWMRQGPYTGELYRGASKMASEVGLNIGPDQLAFAVRTLGGGASSTAARELDRAVSKAVGRNLPAPTGAYREGLLQMFPRFLPDEPTSAGQTRDAYEALADRIRNDVAEEKALRDEGRIKEWSQKRRDSSNVLSIASDVNEIGKRIAELRKESLANTGNVRRDPEQRYQMNKEITLKLRNEMQKALTLARRRGVKF